MLLRSQSIILSQFCHRSHMKISNLISLLSHHKTSSYDNTTHWFRWQICVQPANNTWNIQSVQTYRVEVFVQVHNKYLLPSQFLVPWRSTFFFLFVFGVIFVNRNFVQCWLLLLNVVFFCFAFDGVVCICFCFVRKLQFVPIISYLILLVN